MIDDDDDDDGQGGDGGDGIVTDRHGGEKGTRRVHEKRHWCLVSEWLAQRRKQQNIRSNIQACKRKYCQCIGKL